LTLFKIVDIKRYDYSWDWFEVEQTSETLRNGRSSWSMWMKTV